MPEVWEGLQVFEDLIVIPTNNGYKQLDVLLQSLESTPCPILIIDTGSTDPAHLEYLKEEVWAYGNVTYVTETPMKGYAQGAYLWAYWNYFATHYLFLQDSLVAIVEDVLKPFQEKTLTHCTKTSELGQIERGAIGWASFNFEFDPGLQEAAMRYMYGNDIPQYGIFGPIFYTSRDTLRDLEAAGCLPSYPVHAHHAQGLERAWAMVFKRLGYPVAFIHNLPNVTLTASGLYTPFRKVFLKRK
jgi:hypothetical protein